MAKKPWETKWQKKTYEQLMIKFRKDSLDDDLTLERLAGMADHLQMTRQEVVKVAINLYYSRLVDEMTKTIDDYIV